MNFLIGCCEKQPIRKLGKRLRSYAMSSIAYGAPPVNSFTSAKQDEGWEIVSANIFWM